MMMDIAAYKQSVKSYSDDQLISQHKAIQELQEMSWNNAQYCTGSEWEQYMKEYNEANEQCKILENEISYRHLKF